METNKIRALLVALDTGSLMKASEILGYTSSGITHMMNSLEQELGVVLLDRSPAGVRATEECDQLLPWFTKIIEDENSMHDELDLIGQQKKRLIKLGLFSSTSRNMVPQIIKEYTASHPDTAFQLLVCNVEEITDALSSERVDAAICSEIKAAKFKFFPIKTDNYYAILPPEHPMATRESIDFKDLEDETFIVSPYGTDFDFDYELMKRGMHPKISMMPIDDPAILSMVSCGLGVSVLSDLMIEGYYSDVAIVPLNPPITRTLGVLLYNKPHPDSYIMDFIHTAKSLF